MSIELKHGDKIWMDYGPGLVVGHILESSPDNRLIGISPVPYDEYKKLPLMSRSQMPVTWFDVKYCTYRCHIAYEDLQKLDESLKPKTGFIP